jgi:hypothetical protein
MPNWLGDHSVAGLQNRCRGRRTYNVDDSNFVWNEVTRKIYGTTQARSAAMTHRAIQWIMGVISIAALVDGIYLLYASGTGKGEALGMVLQMLALMVLLARIRLRPHAPMLRNLIFGICAVILVVSLIYPSYIGDGMWYTAQALFFTTASASLGASLFVDKKGRVAALLAAGSLLGAVIGFFHYQLWDGDYSFFHSISVVMFANSWILLSRRPLPADSPRG